MKVILPLIVPLLLAAGSAAQDQGNAGDKPVPKASGSASDLFKKALREAGGTAPQLHEGILPPRNSEPARPAEDQGGHSPAEAGPEYEAYVKSLHLHNKWALDHRQNIYMFQFWASIVIFIVSIGIVVLGLRMSWMQFKKMVDTPPVEKVQSRVSDIGNRLSDGPGVPRDEVAEDASESPDFPDGDPVPAIEVADRKTGRFLSKLSSKDPGSPNVIFNLPRGSSAKGAGAEISTDGKFTDSKIEFNNSGLSVTTPIVGVIILTLSLAFFYMYLKFVFPIQ